MFTSSKARSTGSRRAALTAAVALLLASQAVAQTTNTFTYNSAEQLTQVRETAPMQRTLATSTYDGDGERVTKTEGVTTVIYVRDGDGNVLAEYNAGTGALIADYVYFNGRKVCRVAADGSRRYFHHDPLGTPRALTDTAGTVLWRGEHKAFGEVYTANPAGGDHYTFTGHEWEDESSLLYLHARYYDPSIGRFLSTDPVGGKLDNPQTWNRYSYALNNPLALVDPDGQVELRITDVVVGSAPLWSRPHRTGSKETVQTYQVEVRTNGGELVATFEATRDSNYNGPAASTRGDYGTDNEAPPGSYRGFIRRDSTGNGPGGYRIQLYEPGVDRGRKYRIQGEGETVREHIQLHSGPGCSQGCLLLPGGEQDRSRLEEAIWEATARGLLEGTEDPGDPDLFVTVEDRNELDLEH